MKKINTFRLATFVYGLLVNIPVCFALCLTSAIIGASDFDAGVLTINFLSFNWLNILYNFLVGMTIATLVSLYVPLLQIGRWFTGLFGIQNETYEGNMRYRLLATFIITVIYYLAITPALVIFNYFVLKVYSSPKQAFMTFLISIPFLLIVGFTSSLINDVGAYRVAHRIDKNF